MIDLANSVVLPMSEPQVNDFSIQLKCCVHVFCGARAATILPSTDCIIGKSPYCFAIVTLKRVWLLQAPNEEELQQWMNALDPSLNSKEKSELQQRVQTLESQLAERDTQLTAIQGEFNILRENTEEEHQYLKVCCTTIGKRLQLLKQRLVDQQYFESQSIERPLVQAQSAELTLDTSSSPLPPPLSLAQQQQETVSGQEILMETQLRKEIDSMRSQFENYRTEQQLQLVEIQKQHSEQLQRKDQMLKEAESRLSQAKTELADIREQNSRQEERIEELQREREDLVQRDKLPLDSVKSVDSDQLLRQLGQLKKQLRILESEVIEKVADIMMYMPLLFSLPFLPILTGRVFSSS